MRILVLGGDGYLGWPTALHLSARGHGVPAHNISARRRWHRERATDSLTPIASLPDRIAAWRERSGREILAHTGDATDPNFLSRIIADFLPEAVIHYAEQASGPYS